MQQKQGAVNMRFYLFLPVMILLVAGCATTRPDAAQGSVERISPQALQRLSEPPIPEVSLDELLSDAKHGKSADEIIAKIKASGSRYDLTPSQSITLNKQGLDIKVLEYIDENNKLAQQNAIAEEMNKQLRAKKQAEDALKRERDLARQRYYYDPFWGSRFDLYYGHHYPYYRPRFGWGLGYGW